MPRCTGDSDESDSEEHGKATLLGTDSYPNHSAGVGKGFLFRRVIFLTNIFAVSFKQM